MEYQVSLSMHSFKIILKIIVFVVLFIFLNFCLAFCLRNFSGDVGFMWFHFMQNPKLDVVFVGSSECSTSFNPETIDDVLHCQSYNMGSNLQSFDSSYKAIIEAVRNKQVKTVILTLDYSMLNLNRKKNFGSEMSFLYSNEYGSYTDRLKNLFNYSFENGNYNSFASIVCFFPWVYYHNKNIKLNIKLNIKEKLENKVVIYHNNRLANGFLRNDGFVDYNKIDFSIPFDYQDMDMSVSADVLGKICKVCNMNGVDLLAVEIPTIHRRCKFLANSTAYYAEYVKIKEFFRQYNVDFFDFNFIKSEIYQDGQMFYKDGYHFNTDGAQNFSTSFAHFLKLRKEGQNMEKCFYTPDEYLASINYISAVSLRVAQEDEDITIDSLAYCGSLVKPEYQFLIKKKNDKNYVVIKDYNSEPHCLFKPSETGIYTVRVNARKFGSNEAFDRYNEKDIIYQK